MKTSRALIAGLAAMTVLAIALTVALAVVLTSGEDDSEAIDAKTDASKPPTPIELALSECELGEGGDTLRGGDGGYAIIIDTVSEYGSFQGIKCVLASLGTSEALQAQMDATTAMMGVQSAEEDGLRYQWSYHPDNGVNMTITEQ